jgi:hypothetical protein
MCITKDPRACTIDAPDGCIFVRRKLGFVEHRTLTVPVTVYSTCIGIPCTPDALATHPDLVVAAGLARVEHTLWPVASVKGTEEGAARERRRTHKEKERSRDKDRAAARRTKGHY